MIKVHFCNSKKPGAILINIFTLSRYSHVAIETDKRIYESRLATGVHCPKSLHSIKRTIVFNDLNEDHIKAFLDTQVGKPYDKTAIMSFIFRRDWQETGSWFCSELVAMALKVGGIKNIPKNVSKIDPGFLYKLISIKF